MTTENRYSKEQMDVTFVKDSDFSDKVKSAICTKDIIKEIEDIIKDYLKKSWVGICVAIIAGVCTVVQISYMVIQLGPWDIERTSVPAGVPAN